MPSDVGIFRSVRNLFDRHLIFVTGKGGVGKSTVAAALGLLAARSGLRTIIAELSAQDRIQRIFECHGEPFEEVELGPDLFTISIDPQSAMEEYLRLRIGALGHALSSSRLFHAFAMATPGMRELLSIGKVWELSQAERRSHEGDVYDLVIVDAPATGHGVAILKTPKTFADIARVGPIAHQGRTIATTIADRDFTGLLAVATAEEMPVNETLAMRDALAREELALDMLVVNAVYPSRFDDADLGPLTEALEHSNGSLPRAALAAAVSEHARAEVQREQLERLADGMEMDLLTLPYLFSERLGRSEIELLADVLEAELGDRESATG